jgi:hypothetical protein
VVLEVLLQRVPFVLAPSLEVKAVSSPTSSLRHCVAATVSVRLDDDVSPGFAAGNFWAWLLLDAMKGLQGYMASCSSMSPSGTPWWSSPTALDARVTPDAAACGKDPVPLATVLSDSAFEVLLGVARLDCQAEAKGQRTHVAIQAAKQSKPTTIAANLCTCHHLPEALLM